MVMELSDRDLADMQEAPGLSPPACIKKKGNEGFLVVEFYAYFLFTIVWPLTLNII